MRDAVGVGVRVDGTVAVKEGVLCTALGVGSTCLPCGVEASRVRALAGVIDAVPLWLHAVIVRGRININNRNQRKFFIPKACETLQGRNLITKNRKVFERWQ
jgi:hypothetical protein